MNIEDIREYCISRTGVSETFPFDDETLVFKVMDKMFLLMDINSKPLKISIKCKPEKGIELREMFDCIQPAYHMNKKHWITILINGDISTKVIKEWILESYNLVVKGLTKGKQKMLDTQ